MSNPRLQDFTKAMLEEYIFPGTDAAVVFIPEGSVAPPNVDEVLQRSGQNRWYPVPGGYKAKIPFHFAEGREELFEREKKGWDHEHCSFCEEGIIIGELCWTTPSESEYFIFCKRCYGKLPQKKSWWKFWEMNR